MEPIVIERVVKPEEIIKTTFDLDKFLERNTEKLIVIIFMQEWNESKTTIHDHILEHITNEDLEETLFGRVIADLCPELSHENKIDVVPTIIFFRRKKEIDRIMGARMRDVIAKIHFHAGKKAPEDYPNPIKVAEAEFVKKQDKQMRITELVKRSKVMLFMKGNPDEPKCGFSRAIVGLLNETGVAYDTFDILTDEEVRQGLKDYSNWQTYPQLYVNASLIGGLDIVKELNESGDLIETLNG